MSVENVCKFKSCFYGRVIIWSPSSTHTPLTTTPKKSQVSLRLFAPHGFTASSMPPTRSAARSAHLRLFLSSPSPCPSIPPPFGLEAPVYLESAGKATQERCVRVEKAC